MQATIHNEFLTLTVDTHGAEAVSLKNAAGEEMLWQADPAIWKRHAPILFPWTGKLTGGTFTANGKTYKGGQHGFARDMEHTLLRAEGDTIQLELRADGLCAVGVHRQGQKLIMDGCLHGHALLLYNIFCAQYTPFGAKSQGEKRAWKCRKENSKTFAKWVAKSSPA